MNNNQMQPKYYSETYVDKEHKEMLKWKAEKGKGIGDKDAVKDFYQEKYRIDISDPMKLDWHLQALMQTGDVKLLQKFIAANPD